MLFLSRLWNYSHTWAGNMVELMVTKNVEKCHESQQKYRPPPYPKNFVQKLTEFPGNSVSYSTHLVSVKTTVCLVLLSIFEVCFIQSSFSNQAGEKVRICLKCLGRIPDGYGRTVWVVQGFILISEGLVDDSVIRGLRVMELWLAKVNSYTYFFFLLGFLFFYNV